VDARVKRRTSARRACAFLGRAGRAGGRTRASRGASECFGGADADRSPSFRSARATHPCSGRHHAFHCASRVSPGALRAPSRVAPSRNPSSPPRPVLTENHPSSRLSPSQRNIELGRVCLVNLAADPLYGKLVTIVDFVDMNRVRSASDFGDRAARDAAMSAPRAQKP
jgi:hypothetical protein